MLRVVVGKVIVSMLEEEVIMEYGSGGMVYRMREGMREVRMGGMMMDGKEGMI